MSIERLRIESGKFYIVQAGRIQWIHAEKEGAIGTLTEIIRDDDSINPEATQILEVDTTTDKWSMTTVPWAEVAFGLIRKGK
ncbi:MAG: hypothetical protein ACFFCQ_06175 [Promethearchaeota archaeon]